MKKQIKCKWCKNVFYVKLCRKNSAKYCSRKCYGNSKIIKKKQIKCKQCGNEIEKRKNISWKAYNNKNFCSRNCMFKYFKKNKISAFYDPKIKVENNKKVAITNRKNKTGFNDPKVQSKTHETNKKNKTGFWDPEVRRKAGEKGNETNKKNKTGFWDPKIQSMGGKAAKLVNAQSKAGKIGGKITAMINKKNKIGMCYDKKIQSRAGKIGGPIGGQKAMESNRKNKPYIWKGVHFMSKMEMEFAKTILKKPIDGVNCNIKVGTKTVDFFPQKYDKEYQNSFVEFHPWDRNGLSTKQYHNQRRKVLNENGYKDYPLIVIKK